MAATGLANLAQILLNQTTVAQELPAFPAVTGVGAIARATANASALVDQFVPSSRAGTANGAIEAAGLFTAPQFSLFTAATDAFLAQSAPFGANAAPAAAANAPASGSASVEKQLQALNNSLAALGLSAADIRTVDRIASVINNFNPTSFTSLVYQLEGLAANAAQQDGNAANSPAAATPAATSVSAANATIAAVANSIGGKFALQGLQLQLIFARNNEQGGQAQSVAVTANLTPAHARSATA
jgi:hypothetical protein